MPWSLSNILDRFDSIILGAIELAHNAMVIENLDLFWGAATIAFGILTFKTFTPGGSYDLNQYFWRIFWGIVVYALLMNWEYFGVYVLPLFYDWPGALAAKVIGVVTGKPFENANELFERLATAAIHIGIMIKDRGGEWWEMIINAIIGGVFVFVFGKLVVSALRPLIVAKMSLLLMAAIAPLMVVGILFDRTRQMVIGWAQVMIAAAFTLFFVYLAVALFSILITGFVAYASSIDDFYVMLEILIGVGMVVIAISGLVEEASLMARNIAGAFGLSNPVTGGRAAWSKFVGGARYAASGLIPARRGAVKPA